jgi:hypothetical protein
VYDLRTRQLQTLSDLRCSDELGHVNLPTHLCDVTRVSRPTPDYVYTQRVSDYIGTRKFGRGSAAVCPFVGRRSARCGGERLRRLICETQRLQWLVGIAN